MIFRTTTRVAIELVANVRTRGKSSVQWNARTIEVGRDELWLRCTSVESIHLPQRDDTFVVTIDLPVNESTGRRCMECDTELLALEIVDESSFRVRMRVIGMRIRERESANGDAPSNNLVM